MEKLSGLPLELLELVLVHTSSPPPDLAQLGLVSRQFSRAACKLLVASPTLTSSTQLNRFLAVFTSAPYRKSVRPGSPTLAVSPTRLTLARGIRSRPATQTTGKSKTKRTETVHVEDAITEEEMNRALSAVGSRLEELRLIELGFGTLRRRQLGFVGQLARLRSLS